MWMRGGYGQGLLTRDDVGVSYAERCMLKTCCTGVRARTSPKVASYLASEVKRKVQGLLAWASGQKMAVGLPCTFVSHANPSAIDSHSGLTLKTCKASGNAVMVEFTATGV